MWVHCFNNYWQSLETIYTIAEVLQIINELLPNREKPSFIFEKLNQNLIVKLLLKDTMFMKVFQYR